MPVTNVDELVPSTGWLRNGVIKERMGLGTIATTGTAVFTFIAKFSGVLSLAQLVSNDALAANDTNSVAWAIANRGAGGANVAMLAATAANSTLATGGSGLTAFTKRNLTLNATPANLVVAAGDTLVISQAVTGTLGGAITGVSMLLTFTPS